MKPDARLHLGRIVNSYMGPSNYEPATRNQGAGIKVKIDSGSIVARGCTYRLRRGCIQDLETGHTPDTGRAMFATRIAPPCRDSQIPRARMDHPEAAPVPKTDAQHEGPIGPGQPEDSRERMTHAGPEPRTVRETYRASHRGSHRGSHAGRGITPLLQIDRFRGRVAGFDKCSGIGATPHPHITPLFPSNLHRGV